MEWLTISICAAFVISLGLLLRWLYKDRQQEKEINKQWQELKAKNKETAKKKLSNK
ncbi:hypothetical protein ACFGVS_03295 [Mucilaginibacter sp. AW1-7]|uniref:hypothetical protein n=1 Tax=Mucilaginibacter sp. AW1-7 TaxID=3349874 RepID=UPI003F733768